MSENMPQLQLYIYNDIEDCLPTLVNTDYSKMLRELVIDLILAIEENDNVVLIERDYAVEKITTSYTHKPFDVTFAIGRSGYIVAKNLHTSTGWFPNITLLPVKRNEVNEHEYVIYSRFRKKVKSSLKHSVDRVAIVDDTLYSGLTVKTVLNQMDDKFIPKTHAFFLHALEDGLSHIDDIQNITAGLFIPGKREEDVSVIRASGLFRKNAIRRLHKSSQAFYQRGRWMRRWFPKNAVEIIPLCRQICSLLEHHKRAVANPMLNYTPMQSLYETLEIQESL